MIDDLRAQADRIDAVCSCPECSFDEPFGDFLRRDDRVNVDTKEVQIGCPGCGHDTLAIGTESAPQAYVVSDLNELEAVTNR